MSVVKKNASPKKPGDEEKSVKVKKPVKAETTEETTPVKKAKKTDKPVATSPEEAPVKKVKTSDKAEKPAKAPKEKAAKGAGKPGILGTIRELLSAKSLTKDALLAHLVKKFPDRDSEAMMSTIRVQVPGRLRSDGFNITQNGDKWHIDS